MANTKDRKPTSAAASLGTVVDAPAEQRYRVLADMLPSQVWTARPDGTLDYVNQRVVDYFAKSQAEILGEGWKNVVHPDDLPNCVTRWTHSLQTGEPYAVDFRLRRADGAYRWHQGLARPLRDAQDRIVQWLGTNSDYDDAQQVSQRLQQSAEDLRESERRLRLALDAGQLGTWEWDISAQRVRWSEALERMHGIAPGTFEGTFEAYQRDIHPDDLAHVLETIRANVATCQDHRLLYRIVRPDGETRWLEAHGRFVCDPQGKPLRLSGVCGDVTDRVEAERARTESLAQHVALREAEQARARIQQILSGIGDAFVVCEGDWGVVFANEAGSRLFGRPTDAVAGANLRDLAESAFGPSLQPDLLRVMSQRQSATVESWLAPRNEWLELNLYPLRDGGMAFYARDITARKREEIRRALVTATAALRADVAAALARASDIGAILQDCCDALVKNLPLSVAHIWLVDSSQAELELRAGAGEHADLDAKRRRVRVGEVNELRIGVVAGERKPYHTNTVLDDPLVVEQEWAAREGLVAFAGFPLLAGEELLGVLAGFARAPLAEDTLIAIDGTSAAIAQGIARRRAELELDERARELARSNADLEQFAYVASHDLQEPLRIVASYTQLLARRYQGRLDKDADEFIAFAVDGVRRMQRLITDLLAYSRVGTRGLPFGQVATEQVFGSALQNLKQLVADSNGRVTHDPLPEIVGDQGQLTQLFQNLIGNGLKFHGERPPEVHVSARRDGQGWRFSVADNGVGIEPQYHDRIFVIFQRLHSIDKYPGTGIGLALCKKIVERHGGTIGLESTPGVGSTFTFLLPDLPGSD